MGHLAQPGPPGCCPRQLAALTATPGSKKSGGGGEEEEEAGDDVGKVSDIGNRCACVTSGEGGPEWKGALNKHSHIPGLRQ